MFVDWLFFMYEDGVFVFLVVVVYCVSKMVVECVVWEWMEKYLLVGFDFVGFNLVMVFGVFLLGVILLELLYVNILN